MESTFVFADLCGYSAMTEAHGDQHAADVAAEFFAKARSLLLEYDAEEVKAIGDALLIRVPDADAAVQMAARLLSEFGETHGSLAVRAGVHTGSAVQRDGDWFGGAVNVAARVADVASAGEVVLTGATRAAARDAIAEGRTRGLGPHRLKNIPEPVELLTLELGGAGTALPVDPVCRMAVDPRRADQRAVHGGVEYHFCSATCAEAFARDPASYVGSRSLAPYRKAELRVSDDARERAVSRLGRAYARGRIDRDELEDRTARALEARTRGDLRAVTRDLPRRRRRPFLVRLFRRFVRLFRRRR